MGGVNVKFIKDMDGLIIRSVAGLEQYSDELTFTTECGRKFLMYHGQECCENVVIEDFDGDADDLIGGMVVSLTESHRDAKDDVLEESGTWTFYNLQTTHGSLNIRWLGESNGFYSEEVSFKEVK